MTISRRQAIADTLREEIASGLYPPHEPLPGEHALCARFGVTRATLRLALGDLERRGLIFKHHGSGTFVNPVRSVMSKPLAVLLREPQKATTVGNVPIISGAGYYLESVGSYVALLSSPPAEWQSNIVESLAGVIVVPPLITAADLDRLTKLALPWVVISDSQLPGPSIRFGFHDAAVSLVEELLRFGHRRFAMISGHDAHGDAIRKDAIAGTLSAAGVDFAKVPDLRTNYDPTSAWHAANKLVTQAERPTAVICFDDTLALQMIRACAEHGIAAPQEISVVGFGDAPHASLVSPALTTVRIPYEQAGRAAAEMLCRSVLHGDTPRSIDLGHTICLRESAGTYEGG
ncbi:MAG: GntR family transcriptional regulator [Capsulimonadaceae bacterium]|nr:GntR family transcriptional regulator [Capsulimonadaceae bacterium]